ncbi:peptidoglycan DD-metalloendopeptidase family protein [Gallaecimonas kandeliae]|uniref:peptidoglycan DD-metalloendopeptidase family protein n=1 Tax=Gallaecimonas kandeliae TaxID=3029055 RepID=UPI002648C195|nr:peptidoglycan DD-metalloendopeptidase family protein [Gallaecimonas kandeliae]WKE64844.1 peptidoglycan DD-metalloendopeptidase family protein [Gallaecimonas kandeliae]
MLHLIKALPKRHKILAGGVAALLGLLLFLPSEDAEATRAHDGLQVGQRYPLAVAVQPQASQPLAAPEWQWQGQTVKSGDSLAKLFDRAGVSARVLHELLQDLGKAGRPLTELRPGEKLEFAKAEDGSLAALRYSPSRTEQLLVNKGDKGFSLESREIPVEHHEQFATNTISSNFWNAGVDAGLSPNIIDGIADILGYDIDFALELRRGDSFAVLYDQDYIDGDFIGDGKIQAVTFVNQGQLFQAVRHSDGNYYTPQGKSLRKAFLRSPVNYKYISSSFNPHRLHPVTGKVRPHNGIDYAAKVGTPVYASGDGRVMKSAYSSLNGNYVFIKHGEKFVTKYLHLSKRLVKAGQAVHQGQLIGKVGATGRVTGPHLHYEFLVGGVHRNPRTVKLPEAQPVPAAELAAFKAHAQELLARLGTQQRIMVAMK